MIIFCIMQQVKEGRVMQRRREGKLREIKIKVMWLVIEKNFVSYKSDKELGTWFVGY